MKKEKAIEIVGEAVTEFCAKYEESLTYLASILGTDNTSDCVKRHLEIFYKHPNLLMLDEELLKDKQSIPSMFWRAKKAPLDLFESSSKLLVWLLEKNWVIGSRVKREMLLSYNGPCSEVVTPRGNLPKVEIDFVARRDAEYNCITVSCRESLTSMVTYTDLDDIDLSDLECQAEAEGDYFEIDWDTSDYDTSNMNFNDAYNAETDINCITYIDSEGNRHELAESFDETEIKEACEEIEQEIIERIEAEEAEVEAEVEEAEVEEVEEEEEEEEEETYESGINVERDF